MRHEFGRHHLSDHNSATSGIAPLGTTDPSADPRDSQLPRPTFSRDCSRSVTLGRNGRQSSQGWAARREESPGRAKYPPIWAATWIARVTVVTAPERLFGSRPGGKQALASLTSLPLAGHASIAAALRFHAAA